jgi:DNA-binding transcriptional regulator YiaG
MKLQKKHKRSINWAHLIKEYRLELNLSVVEFAAKYGVSRASVYYWESGQREAPYRVTEDILQALARGEV